jgi:CheY-like chemotaxis protein
VKPIDILLVDDNDDDILLLEESIKGSPLVTLMHVVRDGDEALAYLRREGRFADVSLPGLVLLDINMPRKNGFEVLQAMKADQNLRTIPVIMLTTSSREEDIVHSYDGGACSFICKPLNFDKLKEVVHHLAQYWTLVSKVPPVRQ